MRPLLCIRHQASAPLGIIESGLDAGGIPWLYADLWVHSQNHDPADYSGLIVLGGEMNVDQVDEYAYLKTVRDLTREAAEQNLPFLGICLGAQILTRALDAGVNPATERELGFLEIEATDEGRRDPVLGVFAPKAMVFQFHEDECELPKGAELLFTGQGVNVQAFRYGERAYGVQFHFEVTEREIAAWCDEVEPEVLRTEWGASKAQVLRQAREHLPAQQVLAVKTVAAFCNLLR